MNLEKSWLFELIRDPRLAIPLALFALPLHPIDTENLFIRY